MPLDEVQKHTQALRDAGFAVCVFSPEELLGVKPRYVEDAMCNAGFEAIHILKDGREEK